MRVTADTDGACFTVYHWTASLYTIVIYLQCGTGSRHIACDQGSAFQLELVRQSGPATADLRGCDSTKVVLTDAVHGRSDSAPP